MVNPAVRQNEQAAFFRKRPKRLFKFLIFEYAEPIGTYNRCVKYSRKFYPVVFALNDNYSVNGYHKRSVSSETRR